MNKIQGAIENQDRKWSLIENKMEGQNSRISKIETHLTHVLNLKRNVNKTTYQIETVRSETKAMKLKMSQYESAIRHYSDMCDDITNNSTATERNINNIKNKSMNLNNHNKRQCTNKTR